MQNVYGWSEPIKDNMAAHARERTAQKQQRERARKQEQKQKQKRQPQSAEPPRELPKKREEEKEREEEEEEEEEEYNAPPPPAVPIPVAEWLQMRKDIAWLLARERKRTLENIDDRMVTQYGGGGGSGSGGRGVGQGRMTHKLHQKTSIDSLNTWHTLPVENTFCRWWTKYVCIDDSLFEELLDHGSGSNSGSNMKKLKDMAHIVCMVLQRTINRSDSDMDAYQRPLVQFAPNGELYVCIEEEVTEEQAPSVMNPVPNVTWRTITSVDWSEIFRAIYTYGIAFRERKVALIPSIPVMVPKPGGDDDNQEEQQEEQEEQEPEEQEEQPDAKEIMEKKRQDRFCDNGSDDSDDDNEEGEQKAKAMAIAEAEAMANAKATKAEKRKLAARQKAAEKEQRLQRQRELERLQAPIYASQERLDNLFTTLITLPIWCNVLDDDVSIKKRLKWIHSYVVDANVALQAYSSYREAWQEDAGEIGGIVRREKALRKRQQPELQRQVQQTQEEFTQRERLTKRQKTDANESRQLNKLLMSLYSRSRSTHFM